MHRAVLLAPLLFLSACLPYAVGTTAHTLPAGSVHTAGIVYALAPAVDIDGSRVANIAGADLEMRMGVDDRSDVGVRITSMSGAVGTYKRRIAGTGHEEAAATALVTGAGIVNFGSHAVGELTLIHSGARRGRLEPYGGARVLATVPIAHGAVWDRPTLGLFGGLGVGSAESAVVFELAVYYDDSALDLRRRDVLVVPSITLRRQRRARGDGVVEF